MIFADFSVNSQPIVMKFYKLYFSFPTLEILYGLKVILFNM